MSIRKMRKDKWKNNDEKLNMVRNKGKKMKKMKGDERKWWREKMKEK